MTAKKRYPGPPPEESAFGRCHQDAIAYVLDLPLSAVPHFSAVAPVGEFEQYVRAFLRTRGLVPIYQPFPPLGRPDEVDAILRCVGNLNPGVTHLLGGQTRWGEDHTVVCRDGAVIHNHSRSNSPIITPASNGFYWITFFGSAVASDGPPASVGDGDEAVEPAARRPGRVVRKKCS